MDKKLLLILVDALAKKAAQEIELSSPRGPRGLRGKDGADFNLEEHKDTLLSLLLEHTPKFELTDELRKELKGEKGEPGQDGVDGRPGKSGKDFNFEEVKSEIDQIIFGHVESVKGQLKLKFSDLTDEDKESLQGPRGVDGRDFVFEEHSERISQSIYSYLDSVKDSLKLKFDDLTEEEKLALKGARGQRGKQGVGFDFETSRGEISSIIESYISSISDGFKLRFSDLTEEEKDSLKLKFDNLTEEERLSLKGARGQRGKKGDTGDTGRDGATWSVGVAAPSEEGREGDFYLNSATDDLYVKKDSWVLLGNIRGARGPIGPRGAVGPKGLDGISGLDGKSGKDAPVIVDIETNQNDTQVELVFYFSDGSNLRTSFDIPAPEILKQVFIAGMGASGGDGGGGTADPTIYEADGVEIGPFERVNFVGGTVTEDPVGTLKVEFPTGGGGSDIEIQDEGVTITTALSSMNFIGPNVRVSPRVYLSDWPFLSDVEPSMADYPGPNTTSDDVDVYIEFADPSIIQNVDCDSSVYVGSFVRMTSAGLAVNALADSFANSNVIGLVESKQSATKCTLRVSGKSSNVYSSLDPALEYFLSDTIPGELQTTVPTTSGHIRLKLGQPFSSSSFLMAKGERVERL